MAVIPYQYSNQDYIISSFSSIEANKDVLDKFLNSVGCLTLDEYSKAAVLTWVNLENGIFSVWSVISDLFILSEQSSDGRSLTIVTPVSRVRRLSEESGNGLESTLTLELDADRASMDLSGLSNDDGSVQLQGVFRHSGYVIRATGDNVAHLNYFAFRFRSYLKDRV